MNILVSTISFLFVTMVGRATYNILFKRFIKSRIISDIDIKYFYPLFSLFFIGNIIIIFNFVMPIKNLVIPIFIFLIGLVVFDIYKNKITDGTYPRGTTRALFGAGKTPSLSNVIDFVSIATTGNAADFGDLSVAKDHIGSNVASFTRGCWAGGGVGGTTYIDVVDYVTIVTSGNVADFGNLSASKIGVLGGSNNI